MTAADGFAATPKEAVLKNLSHVKIHRRRPVLKPRTLGFIGLVLMYV
jgi:hypothetical protein